MAGKLLMFEWRCTNCNLKFDSLQSSDKRSIPCIECSSEAKRLISCPRIDPKMGVDPDFGTMSDKWARKKEQQYRINKKKAAEHGDSF